MYDIPGTMYYEYGAQVLPRSRGRAGCPLPVARVRAALAPVPMLQRAMPQLKCVPCTFSLSLGPACLLPCISMHMARPACVLRHATRSRLLPP